MPTVPYPENGVAISEFHRDPARVPDTNGEYVELTNVGVEPVSLREFAHGKPLALIFGSYT